MDFLITLKTFVFKVSILTILYISYFGQLHNIDSTLNQRSLTTWTGYGHIQPIFQNLKLDACTRRVAPLIAEWEIITFKSSDKSLQSFKSTRLKRKNLILILGLLIALAGFIYFSNMNKPSTSSYLKPNRLSDVVGLISVLALEKGGAFKNNENLNKALNGKPKSSDNWFEIAKEHPEFFRFNTDETQITLLFRFAHRSGGPTGGVEEYPALEIDQTQKLLDLAIILHDKQIARLQRNSFLIPLLTAMIAALTTGLVAYYTITHTTKPTKDLDNKLEQVLQLLKEPKSDTLRPNQDSTHLK